ncbi:MAG: hypothetical protein LBL41_00415 [Bifidobacteriaceae bacterium]|jgi:hypothetical protein|nr:hypothetical protein [Bifidobacteriaceae bacterium]
MTTKELSIIEQRLQAIEITLKHIVNVIAGDDDDFIIGDETLGEWDAYIKEYKKDPSLGIPLDQALAEAGINV